MKNKFAGKCTSCGGHVPAGEGIYVRAGTGQRSTVTHAGNCPSYAAAAAPVEGVDALDAFGFFVEQNWRKRIGPAPQTQAEDDMRQLFIMTAGLGGETGEVLELLKKHIRDGREIRADLTHELGDVLHYWMRICAQFGLRPHDVIAANIKKISERATKRAGQS